MRGSAGDRLDELGGVRALTSRRRQKYVERLRPAASRERAELSNRLRRRRDADIRDDTCPLDLGAERKPHALLLERDELASLDPREEQASGIRADVDDPDAHVDTW